MTGGSTKRQVYYRFDFTTDMLAPNSKAWLSNFQISYTMYLMQNQYPIYNILFRSCHWELADEFSKFNFSHTCFMKNFVLRF